MCGTEGTALAQEGEQLGCGGGEHEGYLDPILMKSMESRVPLEIWAGTGLSVSK